MVGKLFKKALNKLGLRSETRRGQDYDKYAVMRDKNKNNGDDNL